MTAKQAAIKDIRESLRQEGKSFLLFRKELNPVMRTIVSTYLKAQKK